MQPIPLKPNDKIAVIAPSGSILPEDLKTGLELIENWQLKPEFGKYLFDDYYLGYHYAGDEDRRTEDFQNALDNDEIKAIWFARGGYGAVHLIDKIDWTKFIRNPKWLIGYSDITAFHNHINNFNIPTIHGITVKRLNCKYSEETFSSLRTILFGGKLNYEIAANPYNQTGTVMGELVGGNLSLIYSLMGSQSEIRGENLILFIEDWCENWYHLDRMLMSLKRAGFLDKIKGMIVGNFTRMDVEQENPEFLNDYDSVSFQIIHKFIKNYKIPVCFGFPAGHTGDNRALIMGDQIQLEVKSDIVKLTF